MIDAKPSELRDSLLQQALALEAFDRAFIAEALEQSLGASDFATPDVAEAWAAEIEHRAAACERGEMPAENWRNVIGRLRQGMMSGERTRS